MNFSYIIKNCKNSRLLCYSFLAFISMIGTFTDYGKSSPWPKIKRTADSDGHKVPYIWDTLTYV